MKLKSKILKIDPLDNVIVALSDLHVGEIIENDDFSICLNENISAKHKFAIKEIGIGDKIYMYGVVVGRAKKKIKKGEAITTKNVIHEIGEYSIPSQNNNINWDFPDSELFSKKTFLGYHRDNGSVGTENNWLVIPLVFCQNRNIETLKNTILKGLGYENQSKQKFDITELIDKYKSGTSERDLMNVNIITDNKKKQKNPLFPNVDGIYFLTHDGGCGGSNSDAVTLCNLIAGYINNPNVAGATILSLGCQHAQISILERSIKRIAPNSKKTVFFLEQQQSNSETEYISEAIKKTFIGLVEANKILENLHH